VREQINQNLFLSIIRNFSMDHQLKPLKKKKGLTRQMIKGIGMDLVELDRIEKLLKRNGRFQERVLTAKEKEIFSRLPTERRQVEFLAGRFAANEALAKAAGTGIGKLSFQDIEVLPSSNGAPQVYIKGFEQLTLHISITHSKTHAAAQAVIEE